MGEYRAWPSAMPEKSLVIRLFTLARASAPRSTSSPMWLTSNSPQAERTALCSAITPLYCTGSSHPAKGTIFPPAAVWRS